MNINWRIIIPIVLLLIYALELADKLMKMNMEKAIMVAVSLLLYISACCTNVFAGGDRNPGWAARSYNLREIKTSQRTLKNTAPGGHIRQLEYLS